MGSLTLNDWAARMAPDGKIARIIEILRTQNEILEDMSWIEGNLADGVKTTIRSGLPKATWRALYEGIQPQKSETVQVVDACGTLETYSILDKQLAELNGNTAQFRLTEEQAFIQGMNQQMASMIFYGNVSTNPKGFHGLTPRYDSLAAPNASNILNAGGAGNTNTSIWLVVWSDITCSGVFPKAQISGLQHRDLGEITKQLPDGSQFQSLQSHYKWQAGMTLRDWRYVVRIGGIDVTKLKAKPDVSAGDVDLVDLLAEALEIPPSLTVGRCAIYCNRTIKSFLRRQQVHYDTVRIGRLEAGGKHITLFDDIPVRRVDAILNTEAPIGA